MADTDIVQVIAEARIDARSLSEFVWKPIDFMVTRRLAPPINTLNFYIDKLNNYTTGLDIKLTAANVVIDNKVTQAGGQIDVIVRDAVVDSKNKTASIVQLVKDDINNVLNQTIDNASFNIIDSFELGATLTKRTDALRHTATGKLYRWGGDLPKAVPEISTPLLTGGFGSNAWLEVSDVALRQELQSDKGHWLVNNQMAANAYGAPASLTNIQVGVDAPTVVSYFHEYFWGTRSGNLERSRDGVTWEVYCAIPGWTPMKIIPTSDGEVLVLATDSRTIRKSTNWASGSPTWSTSLQGPTPGSENPILRWGFDGSGSKFIVTHYGSGGNSSAAWENSRYVWISTDAGDTWDVVWDTQEQFPESFAGSHLHATCYDQWADRFYFTGGHGTPHGMYYSDDDGVNWTKIQNIGLNPAPTVLVSTDFGIVMGTDSEPNGVAFLPRSNDPDDVVVQMLATVSSYGGRGSVIGFADVGMRDPDTGIVYIGFNSQFEGNPSTIFAVGSGGASIVYESVGGGPTADIVSRFSNVVAAKGKLLATHSSVGRIVADVPPFTQQSQPFDRGNLFPEVNQTRMQALAVGRNAKATGLNSLSVGAVIIGQDCIGIGFRGTTATGANAVAVGNTATAASNGVSVGFGAEGTSNCTSVGYLSKSASESVAYGAGAEALGVYSIAIGRSAKVPSAGSYATAIGRSASAESPNCISIGNLSKTVGDRSIAVGNDASASAGGSTAIGDLSVSAYRSVSVGVQSTSGSQGTAIGWNTIAGLESLAVGCYARAESTLSVAVGRGSTAAGTSDVVVGASASSGFGLSSQTVVGRSASSAASFSTALGANAQVQAGHDNSVALGRNSVTQRSNSVCVGARDIESTKNGGAIYLKSPDGTSYKITIADDGTLTATAA